MYLFVHIVTADRVAQALRGPRNVPLEDIDSLPALTNIEAETAEALVLAQISELIRQLAPLDAQVIVLWLEGESAAEISAITGLSAGAVSVRVHRIKVLLAGHFETPERGETP